MKLICKGNMVSLQAELIAFLKWENDRHLGLMGRLCSPRKTMPGSESTFPLCRRQREDFGY